MDPTVHELAGALDELAPGAREKIRDHFVRGDGGGDGSGEQVKDAIKLMSIYGRVRATRANETANKLILARMMGLTGEALAPIWDDIVGASAEEKQKSPLALESKTSDESED